MIDDELFTYDSADEVEYVKLGFMLLPDDRDHLINVLNQIKRVTGLTSHAQGIVYLASRWEDR